MIVTGQVSTHYCTNPISTSLSHTHTRGYNYTGSVDLCSTGAAYGVSLPNAKFWLNIVPRFAFCLLLFLH